MFRTSLLISFLLLLSVSATATTVLLLKDGGTIEGELLNPGEISRKTYRMKTAEGLEISIDARLVERVQSREREALVEYNATAPLTENTVEVHLQWAKWCHERQLPDQAKIHWQQILELDNDHADARAILGYRKDLTGGWYSQQERLENRGFVQERNGGRWRTPYQIQVEEILAKNKEIDLQWQKTVKDLCRKLPNAQAEAELLSISDPAAFTALRDALLAERENKNPHKRTVLIKTLVRLNDVNALRFVTAWSVRPDEPSEDIRQICVEELQKRIIDNPAIRQIMIETYRDSLRRPNMPLVIIQMVSKVLGDIGGYEAIPELIDVLMVLKKTEIRQEQPQTFSFGGGKSGIEGGSKPIIISERVQNLAALTALRKLTGVNYGFDQAAWRKWYQQPQRSSTTNFNLRRD
jgi:hypothetical protein